MLNIEYKVEYIGTNPYIYKQIGTIKYIRKRDDKISYLVEFNIYSDCLHSGDGRGKDFHCWWCNESDLITIKTNTNEFSNPLISIYQQENKLIVVDFKNHQKSILFLEDKNNYNLIDKSIEALQAFSPITSLYNGKIVCVDPTVNENIYTKGKIYEFVNGHIINDKGRIIPSPNKPSYITSFKDWENFSTAKWVELVE
jgi:hypothetical protein